MTDTTPTEPTLEQLRKRAGELDVQGRSKMDAGELAAAIAAAEDDARRTGGDPAPPEIVGRPPLVELAEQRAANRNPRVIGAPNQED